MKMIKRFGLPLLIAVAGMFALEAGDKLLAPGQLSVVGQAQAIIGRPLTPVSVAGVARRTVRRCAVGVYYC